ncbi:MAG: glycosyltransferase family 4 protein [Candidatus Zixiibacteriota bacterium]
MSDAPRILILTHNYPRYQGDFAGVFIATLAKRLIDQGLTPIVLAPHDAGAAEYEIQDGVIVYRFRYADDDKDQDIAYRGSMHNLVLGSISGIFKFKRFLDSFRTAAIDIIKKEQIQLIAGNWLVPSGIVMKSLATYTELPMILSSHGTDIRIMAKYMVVTRKYFGKFFPRLSKWTVVSSFLRDEILRIEPGLGKMLEVLPLPHDETLFYRDEAVTRDPNMILAVTRFTEQKRVEHLVNAFAMVAERHKKARLDIYGSGPMQPAIETLISELGIHKRVVINQPVPQQQLRALYNQAGMVVLNSFQEGFGLALSEAMLCGAPVIGTASGGIPDIIKHNERGLLVELDNSTALADAMVQLLNDRALADRLADAGHTFALANYASGPLAARFAQIVQTALSRAHK